LARSREGSTFSVLLMGFNLHKLYSRYKRENEARYAEAYRWVMDQSNEYAFAFIPVCEALGIHPDYLRYGLANASNTLLVDVGKSRRKFLNM